MTRKNDAATLASSDGRLRSILDGMSEGFSLFSPDFIVLDVNAEAVRLELRTRDQIVGRSHWDLYPGTEHGPLGVLYKRAMRDRVTVGLEHRHVWTDGRVFWLDMRAYPTGDGCLAVFFRDVTARHVADRQLRESADRFEAAVRALADVLWTNDADGQMIGEQPGWAALTVRALMITKATGGRGLSTPTMRSRRSTRGRRQLPNGQRWFLRTRM